MYVYPSISLCEPCLSACVCFPICLSITLIHINLAQAPNFNVIKCFATLFCISLLQALRLCVCIWFMSVSVSICVNACFCLYISSNVRLIFTYVLYMCIIYIYISLLLSAKYLYNYFYIFLSIQISICISIYYLSLYYLSILKYEYLSTYLHKHIYLLMFNAKDLIALAKFLANNHLDLFRNYTKFCIAKTRNIWHNKLTLGRFFFKRRKNTKIHVK